ncbi:TRAP transporter small permease [Clostridium sp.]|uniref:TRAP transporter small permease n=1 Tax=Clostridium sp. TaxID=1506 RepID=UPI002FCB8D46
MNNALNKLFKSIEVLMAIMLGGMIVLVFMNVILRYFFNSGITWSEEMARYLFLWLTFIGAIGAMRDNAHLGVDTIIKRLKPKTQKVVYIFGQLITLAIMIMLAQGSFNLTLINLDSKASATNLPMYLVYGIGIVASVCISLNILSNIYKAIFVEGAMETLIQLQESEEEALVENEDVKGGKK